MSNIPKSFQDYDENDPEIEFRKKRWNYWESLKKIRKEYMQNNYLDGQFDAYDFEEYVKENYGFKMNTLDGNITDKFEIVDEKKYIFFILKFG
jgi:hypothetical protein